MMFLTREIPPRTVAAVMALALLASILAGREKPSAEVMTAHAAVDRQTTAEVLEKELDIEKLKREPSAAGGTAGTADLFAPHSFAPPPPKTAAAPAAPPGPPQLPFTYLGKVIDGGRTSVFVARGDENYSLEAGQTIAGSYRVERIDDTAVTFTYLPMKARQKLAIPAGN